MFDVLIIGAGINGLAAASFLSEHKGIKAAIVEQFTVGHRAGSSHGKKRILRLSYADPEYIHQMKQAQALWPLWEQILGESLIQKQTGCFFGQGRRFRAFVDTLLAHDLDVEVLERKAALREFPQFRFEQVEAVVKDRTGGLIAAEKTLLGLQRFILHHGIELYEKTHVTQIKPRAESIRVVTNQGTLECRRLIVTAGPWVGKLLPQLNTVLTPVRQIVGFFRMPFQGGPHWASIEDQTLFYGLPEESLMKVSEHRSQGDGDDPDKKAADDPERLQLLEKCVAKLFVQPGKLSRSESCFYTSTKTEDFIIAPLPEDPRIIVGSACAGHGFKFAPLTGKTLIALALHGDTAN